MVVEILWEFYDGLLAQGPRPYRRYMKFVWTTEQSSTTRSKVNYLWHTLCRSEVWIGMKVLGTDSFILGTRKLLWMFPIKQKCHTTAAFLDNQKSSIWSSMEIFLPLCSRAWCANKLHNGLSKKLSGFKHFYYKKKLPWY